MYCMVKGNFATHFDYIWKFKTYLVANRPQCTQIFGNLFNARTKFEWKFSLYPLRMWWWLSTIFINAIQIIVDDRNTQPYCQNTQIRVYHRCKIWNQKFDILNCFSKLLLLNVDLCLSLTITWEFTLPFDLN